MSVIIGILDSNQNTDVIVNVDTVNQKLIWIPRDLYIFPLRNRINIAFSKGGHTLFLNMINRLGYKAKHSICIPHTTSMKVFESLKISVPIREYSQYYYPLKPFTFIEDGQKIIQFDPPSEELYGERIHQYLGARYRIDKKPAFLDFDRIARQQLFLKALLETKFDFSQFLKEPIYISDQDAIQELKKVNSEYQLELFDHVVSARIRSKEVLLKKTWYAKLIRIYLNRVDPFLSSLNPLSKCK